MSQAGIISASSAFPPTVTETLTGNSGVATAIANNINVKTANATVKFVGSSNNLIQDFGLNNLALGSSLPSIGAGVGNATFGNTAGSSLVTGSNNCFFGLNAGASCQNGNANCAFGEAALTTFTTGAIGLGSNTAIGNNSLLFLTTGTFNSCLGDGSGTNYLSNEYSNICLSNAGVTGDMNVIRIGAQGNGSGQQNTCFIAGITGVTTSNSQMVTLNTVTGQLGAAAIPSVPTLPLSLANGGTGASLTASNGGIFYSNASTGAILAGTATAGQIIRSGASAAPTWSTTTYPATNAINTILYASAANVMSALATANTGVLATNASGVPSISQFPQVAGLGLGASPGSTTGLTFDGTNFMQNYSVGTFTPTITNSGTPPTIVYSVQKGNWTRIGNRVFVDINISITSFTLGSSNAINITGLPFSVNGTASTPTGTAWTSNIALSPDTYTTSQVTPGGTVLQIIVGGNSVGGGALFANAFPAGSSSVFLSIVYQV